MVDQACHESCGSEGTVKAAGKAELGGTFHFSLAGSSEGVDDGIFQSNLSQCENTRGKMCLE